MNSNRTRYASTPTYGMQKRNFMKKPAAARQISQTPDFSQAPDLPGGMPFQAQPTIPQPMMQMPAASIPPATPPNGFMPGSSFYPGAAQGMQIPQQMPFATPSFVQSGMPLPPMQNSVPQPMAQPLGNSVPPVSGGHFSSRAQGFVPPQAAPVQQQRPTVQPAQPPLQMPFAAMPQQPVQPFGGMQASQQPFGYQTPPQQQSMAFGQPPQNAPQQPRTPREPFNADKLWTLFLFGLLPLLFIPCLFAAGAWGAVRYVFIGAAVIGLGAMWYRQMYTPTMRLIVSMVYVALCIGSIAMQMQANADVRQTSANAIQKPAVQQQAAAVTETESAEPTPTAVPATPTPLPVSGPSEAEKRLELFMNLWMVNNTTEMVQLVQPSWCSKQENPSMALFMVLANRTPEDFIIEDISGSDTDNSRTITMRSTINKNNGKAPSIYRFMIMMVKEGEEWYVNPNSLATNDKEATKTDENVVKTQSVGTATEAPRTTVTPAPPASTTLYYNMGGNYYHMDPNCPSVNADNLPFDGSFSYSDLKEIKSTTNFLPCLKCGAPVNTLEDAVQ
ncbi:MAG: hypothetical protein J6K55_00925 [Clostridia bacterium]|nr:hypothetical protein [Clostridia bacterium]